MDFKETLYQYISENAYSTLIEREEYQRARAGRNAAEAALTETLTAGQQELFEKFVNELFSVCELETRFYFTEALSVVRGLLTA